MSLQNEIKKLQQKADSAEEWKQKYFELRENIVSAIEPINRIIIGKNTTNKTTACYLKTAESIYRKLENDDSKQCNSNMIELELESFNYKVSVHSISAVRSALSKMPGINFRYDGRTKYLFLVKPKEEKQETKINGSFLA